MLIDESRRKVNPRILRRLHPDYRDRECAEYLKCLSWLGDDMATRGQRQDVLTCLDPDDVERVLDGQTRCDAAALRGLDVWIRRIEAVSRGAQITETYLGNTVHRDFEYLEDMAYWQELIVANDWSQSQLAKAIGKSTSDVSKKLSLQKKATEEELAMLVEKDKAKRLPFRALEALVRHFANPADRKLWIEKMRAGLLCCESLEAELAKLKARQRVRKPKLMKLKLPNGSVIMIPDDIDKEKLAADITALDSIKKRADKEGLPYTVLARLVVK